jgi:pimeloyl-[acyl-carrier protein] methyl ester esterase
MIFAQKIRCIFLSGLDGSGELFASFLTEVSDYIEPIIIPYPNNQKLSYQELADYVYKKLPKDVEYYIIAESFSGPIGILVADRRPSGLKGLILVATFASSPFLKLSQIFIKLLDIFGKIPIPNFVINFFLLNGFNASMAITINKLIEKTGRIILIDRVKSVLTCDVTKQLEQISIPILAIQALQDRILPMSCIDKMVISCPKMIVSKIDAPHFVLQTKYKYVSEKIIKPFILE